MPKCNPHDRFSVERIEGLQAVMQRYLRDSGLAWMLKHRNVVSAWNMCAGQAIAEKTRVRMFRGGVLTIDVYSSAQKSELELFGSDLILRALREELGDNRIRSLRFTLAEEPPQPPLNGELEENENV